MPAVATPQAAPLASDAAVFKPASGQVSIPTDAARRSLLPLTNAPASLYVGDLDQLISEAHLFEIFSSVGPVASARVCRDSTTHRSLGYAYINYHSPVDAERAIELLNHTFIHGKACRVMWSQRDPASRKDINSNVFIKNLDVSIDNKALQDTFSTFGKILSCKVASEAGVSKGYGFIHFEKREDAQNAIQNVNGMQLNGQVVYVGFHENSKDRQSKSSEAHSTFTNVYAKGLASSVTSDQLKELFSKYGPVTSCVVQTDSEGKSKEFGFVNFESHKDAVAAIEALNEQEFAGSKMLVCRAQKKSEREAELRKKHQAFKEEKILKSQGANLYVKNLENSITEEMFASAFAPFGTITSSKIMVDEKNKSRGFGFISYSLPAEAAKAVSSMNGAIIASKPLYVNFAQRKEERRSHLEAQHSIPMQMGMASPMYPNTVFYPPGPNYPPPAQPGMMYPQVNMMPPRPQWSSAQQLVPGQYAANPSVPQPAQQPRNPRQGRNQNRGNNRNHNSRQPISTPAAIPTPISEPAPASPTLLTAAVLAAADPEKQKQMIGEQLYPLVLPINEEFAGKITGMLLEMDNDEILHLIEDAESLNQKVAEALSVIIASSQ